MKMTAKERAKANVLIIEADAGERNNMKSALKMLGYGGLSDVSSHAAAFDKLEQRSFSHVLFDAKETNMPPKEFLKRLLEMEVSVVAIPCSSNPQIDDVFNMLIMGARGFLVKPFTTDTVENAIVMATKGEPISDLVLQAKDRNEALVAIMMSGLDKAATILRQSTQFDTAKREIPKVMSNFRNAAELAKTFAKGGDEGLLEAMERFCIERSKGPATRLGRLRKRLKTGR
jgi:DNA-binding NtrC family response regulator